VSLITAAGSLPVRWVRSMRHREAPYLDHSRLRWYRAATRTYQLAAHGVIPAALRLHAQLEVEGLENIPTSGPVILAANHRDNLDGYLLVHIVPRTVHVAARPNAFGTGALCAVWRRLCAFPADAWGMRYALSLLADNEAIAVFPQAMISAELRHASGAVGLLALRSGAPVVPVAITGSERVRFGAARVRRPRVRVRFGPATTYARAGVGAAHSLEVAAEILRRIESLLNAPVIV
jgi:1-acyl-sn-glycerol-3-phosphate acyltransferase